MYGGLCSGALRLYEVDCQSLADGLEGSIHPCKVVTQECEISKAQLSTTSTQMDAWQWCNEGDEARRINIYIHPEPVA